MGVQISDITTAAVVVSAFDNKGNSSSSSQSSVDANSQGAASMQSDSFDQQSSTVQNTASTYGADDQDNSNTDQQNEDDQDNDFGALDDGFVSEMTKELNELMEKMNCDLEFHYNKEVDIMSVKMINKRTKEVIKEYPPEDMVKGMIRAKDWLGAFLDKKV